MGLVVLIGGSGITDSPLVAGLEWQYIDTHIPTFDILGNVVGSGRVWYQRNEDLVFIPRHGVGKREQCGVEERFGPSRTQYAANIVAACMLSDIFSRNKQPPVIIATSAVGSLHEPGQSARSGRSIPIESLVVPDDGVDESRRDDNLFGVGLVVHANPRPLFSPELRRILLEEGSMLVMNAQRAGTPSPFASVEDAATYVCIPGDRFGTTAEGKKRGMYADIVGMTVFPEASMALQVGAHYAVACFPVDYDTDASHEHSTLAVMERLSQPERVPLLMERVVKRAQEFANAPPLLKQLEGNIIPGDTSRITNPNLRNIADVVLQQYVFKKTA